MLQISRNWLSCGGCEFNGGSVLFMHVGFSLSKMSGKLSQIPASGKLAQMLAWEKLGHTCVRETNSNTCARETNSNTCVRKTSSNACVRKTISEHIISTWKTTKQQQNRIHCWYKCHCKKRTEVTCTTSLLEELKTGNRNKSKQWNFLISVSQTLDVSQLKSTPNFIKRLQGKRHNYISLKDDPVLSHFDDRGVVKITAWEIRYISVGHWPAKLCQDSGRFQSSGRLMRYREGALLNIF